MDQDEFMRLARLLDEARLRLDAEDEIAREQSEREQPDQSAQPVYPPSGEGQHTRKLEYWRDGNWWWIPLILLTCFGVIVWIKSHLTWID